VVGDDNDEEEEDGTMSFAGEGRDDEANTPVAVVDVVDVDDEDDEDDVVDDDDCCGRLLLFDGDDRCDVLDDEEVVTEVGVVCEGGIETVDVAAVLPTPTATVGERLLRLLPNLLPTAAIVDDDDAVEEDDGVNAAATPVLELGVVPATAELGVADTGVCVDDGGGGIK
jgi:hypothetical protein